MKGQFTRDEIMSQPEVWADVLDAFMNEQPQVEERWKLLRPTQVLFIGCGSTYYLSQTAAALFKDLTGIPSSATPSSELLLFPSLTLDNPQQTLLVAISRSGTTTETLQAVRQFRAWGGRAVWTIGCYAESELMQLSDLSLVAEAAHEQSVAQTRSFSSMLLLAKALAATVAGVGLDDLKVLPGQLRKVLAKTADLSKTLGQRLDLDRTFFLGSGFLYGIANEAMLKMKEMSLSNSEGFHFLEFRHGPMSMANEQALVIGLIGNKNRMHEQRVLTEMSALGAVTLGLNTTAEACCLYQVELGAGLAGLDLARFVPAAVTAAFLLPGHSQGLGSR